jgi:hypothetical protein
MKKKKLILVSFAVTAVLVTVFFFSYKYFAPFGKLVSYQFISKLPGAQEIVTFPTSPNSTLTIPSQILRTNQVRFSINLLSKNIQSVQVRLRCKKGPREIRLGIRGNESDIFTYLPLYQSQLQDLDWNYLEEGNFILWQKEKKYRNLSDFVNDATSVRKVVSYYVDVDKLSLLKPPGTAGNISTVITDQLRGNHTLLVRVDKTPLILKVAKQDYNAYEGEDKYRIAILKGSRVIAEQTIGDDGITQASNLMMQPQETTLTLKDINPGLYQVNLINEGSDSFISRLEVNQQKVVFKDYLFPVGSKPSSVWTNAGKITMTTWHEESLQTAKLNGNIELQIKERNKKYAFDLAELTNQKDISALFRLDFPKNDAIIEAAGYFAFNKDSFFYPDVISSIQLSSLDNINDADYVLSSYKKAKPDGDWLVAQVSFDPKDIKINGDKLFFSLEMPDLAKYGGELEIDSLEIQAQSKGILESSIQKAETPPSNIPKKTTSFFTPIQNSISSVGHFFISLPGRLSSWFSNLTKKPTKSPVPTPTRKPSLFFISPSPQRSSPTPIPTKSPSLTPATPPTPSPKAISITVKVFNGGALPGTASKFADTLKSNGFINVSTGNLDSQTYKNAILRYRSTDKSFADQIANLLAKDYLTIDRGEGATTSAEIVVILGAK